MSRTVHVAATAGPFARALLWTNPQMCTTWTLAGRGALDLSVACAGVSTASASRAAFLCMRLCIGAEVGRPLRLRRGRAPADDPVLQSCMQRKAWVKAVRRNAERNPSVLLRASAATSVWSPNWVSAGWTWDSTGTAMDAHGLASGA